MQKTFKAKYDGVDSNNNRIYKGDLCCYEKGKLFLVTKNGYAQWNEESSRIEQSELGSGYGMYEGSDF